MPTDTVLARGHIQFIEARFFGPDATQSDIKHRLIAHLRKLRGAEHERRLTKLEALLEHEVASRVADVAVGEAKCADAEDTEGDDLFFPSPDRASTKPRAIISLSGADHSKVERRACRLFQRREAASGLKHLKKEDRERLEVLAGGVRLATIPSEHRADELAAELHGEFPWLAPATEVVWCAMRRSVQEGWPGFRMPPLLLDGPAGIGKSVWARRLGGLIGAPSMIVEATNDNASFGVVGSQRGWSNAAPGRLIQTILQHLCGNPIVVVDEVEKAGSVGSDKGRSFDLAASLLPLLEPATARSWSCPFFETRFDMGSINWVLTSNDRRLLSEPLRSRCIELQLQEVSVADLVAFARREGRRRGLSDLSIEAIVAALEHPRARSLKLNLRSVIRMLDRAAHLERTPKPN